MQFHVVLCVVHNMGKIAVVGNLKGGTGKSTISVNLASALSKHGSTTLVDADEQGTATDWADGGELPITVIPAPLLEDKATSQWVKKLATLSKKNDYVVIDLPPNTGLALRTALLLANLFIMPVTPSGLDLKATGKAINILKVVRKERKKKMPPALLVPSRVDKRTSAGKEIEAVLHAYKEPVAPCIMQRSAHVDAFTSKEWIGDFAKNTLAHQDIESLAVLVRRIMEDG